MKYKEELIEKVRKGEAQIQVDSDDKWNDLLNTIFLKRNKKMVYAKYYRCSRESVYNCFPFPVENLPIIHAKDFIIQESEVNWVEVSDDEKDWERHILLADLGERIWSRYIVVAGDTEYYLNGGTNIGTYKFRFMRPIPQPEPLTHKQIEEMIGKPFKYVEE